MGKFLIFFGAFMFVALVVSLFPMAKYLIGVLDFYFVFIFIPLLLTSIVMVIIGGFLSGSKKKKMAIQKKPEAAKATNS